MNKILREDPSSNAGNSTALVGDDLGDDKLTFLAYHLKKSPS